MATCTAPVAGHIPGSDAERDCPVHGGSRAGASATVSATPPPSAVKPQGELFWVEDSHGDGSELVGGEVCDEARFVFKHGQCLALASVLAEHFGTGRVFVAYNIDREEEYLGDGEVNTYEHPDPIHVWADAGDGVLVDYDGETEPELIVESFEDHHPDMRTKAVSVAEAQEWIGGYMADQNYDFARTFVGPVTEGKTRSWHS